MMRERTLRSDSPTFNRKPSVSDILLGQYPNKESPIFPGEFSGNQEQLAASRGASLIASLDSRAPRLARAVPGANRALGGHGDGRSFCGTLDDLPSRNKRIGQDIEPSSNEARAPCYE